MIYIIEFWCKPTTTTGTPNKQTGRMSIACDLHTFGTNTEANLFILKSKHECKRVCRKDIRKYKLGYSIAEYNEWFEMELMK